MTAQTLGHGAAPTLAGIVYGLALLMLGVLLVVLVVTVACVARVAARKRTR